MTTWHLHKNDLIVTLTDLLQEILAQRFGCHLSKVLFHIVSDLWKVGNEARTIKVSNMQIRFNPNCI